MCIAIVKPCGVAIPRDRLKTCFINNPDGAGFAIARDGKVTIHKGYTTFEAFHAAYLEHGVDAHAALVHFRITTRGADGPENHHPFPLAIGALIHNGTIDWLGRRGEGPSDTQLFARMLHDQSAEQLARLRPMIEASTGWSRFAVLIHDGEVLLFNTPEWEEADGVLYSNNGYLPDLSFNEDSVHPASSTDPTTWILYGFQWNSNLTLFRKAPDGVIYRDIDLEDEVLDAWMAYGGHMPESGWDWSNLDELTIDIIEEEHTHGTEELFAAEWQ
jgi:hypothetical protein